MTFRSRGCPLADLYPDMVDRVKQAWSRQHTTEAADLVLRRYRKWRQQPSRSSFNSSLSAPLRHVHRKQIARREHLGCSPKNCEVPRLPSKAVTTQQAWSAPVHSPGRGRRPQPEPIFVMDLSGVSENPVKVSLNETFDVPEPKPPSFHFSVSRSRESPDLSLRSKRLTLAAHLVHADGNCTCVTDRPHDHRSPVRQSPVRTKVATTPSRSPRASWRNPGAHSMEGFSRQPMRRRSMSESLTYAANVPLSAFCLQDSHLSFQSQPSSTRSASTSVPRHPRRHLSYDSSLPVGGSSWSSEQLDDEFIKFYHRFVCQNGTSFHPGPPCRFCARSSEVSRGHPSSFSDYSSSSSDLAALALSPHRSLLRKRHREEGWDSRPQSKRLRDEYYASSPGSKRHIKEILRRRLSPSKPEQSCYRISFSPRSSNLLSRFNNQPHQHQDTWMSQSSR